MAPPSPNETPSKHEHLPKCPPFTIPSVSPPFVQTPFMLPQHLPFFFFFSSKPNTNTNTNNININPSDALHNLQRAISSTADKCLHFLHTSVTHNPFLNKLLSLSTHIHNFSQAQCRNCVSLNSLSSHNFAAVLPGDSVAGIVAANGILNFLNIYNTILVVRLVLTWFPNAPPQIVSPLSTLCDPYLNIFRGIIPPLGGLDLSPILAFLVLNAFTSAASALPAELPPSEISHEKSPLQCLSDLTSSQKKWRRRLQGNLSSNSNNPK